MTTENDIRSALEAQSGKRCGEGFGLCYSPEFIALGSVIHDMLNPDFVLVGESDPKSGAILGYAPLTPFPEGIRRFVAWFRRVHGRTD